MHQVGSTVLPVFWPRELSLSAARPHSREEERVGRCCAEEAPRMQRKPSVIRHCNLENDLYSRLPMEVAMNINSIKNSGFSSHLKFGIVKQYQKKHKEQHYTEVSYSSGPQVWKWKSALTGWLVNLPVISVISGCPELLTVTAVILEIHEICAQMVIK